MNITTATINYSPEVLDCLKVLNTKELSCFDEKMVAKLFEHQQVLVYKEDGIVKGACSIKADIDDRSVELYALGVKPEYNGQGIGKALALEVERIAKEDIVDIETVYVCSFHFYGVKDFYLNLGYTLLDDSKTYMGFPYYVFAKLI